MRWAVHVAHTLGRINMHTVFFLRGGPEGKKIQGRSWCRWEDNIKMGLKEIVWIDLDWIYMAQNSNKWSTVADSVMNLRVP
jgi:hypothetical protein